MSKPNEERDIYYIPPNFLASGRLFGGMIRARNAIEACVLVLLTGIPIIKLPMSLTVRIIILCLLPLPLGIFGIIGFEGDSLSEFAINWVRWFIHRRNLYRSDVTIPETARKQKKRIWEQEATKPPEQLGIRIKQPRKKRKRPTKTEKQLNKNNRKMVPSHKKQVTYSEDFVPVKDIRNGIIETEDGRYIKVLEVEPINFLLRSTSEQKNIVASFASWMKISPIKIQIKVLTKKADIGKHLSTIERDMESESSEDLLELNDLERGVTREDSEEAKWGYLAGAVRRQQILTGIVSAGMTYTENGMPIVPIDFEGLCVKIPVREMTLIEWPEDEPIPRSVRVQIGRMLGATIDFIPAGVDFKERVAIGSRKAAMLQRQKRYYASGRVKPGILMACRVLTVGNNTMMVEACGVDTEIYARNVSWEWFSDIADLHSTGDLVVARVLDVTYNEQRDTYAVNLSIKDASENPDRAALEKIVPNSNYFGVVTGVKDRVFFVRLQAGVNAKTKLYRSIDMPSRLDTVSFRVTRVDEENGIALGFITRIIKRHTRLR